MMLEYNFNLPYYNLRLYFKTQWCDRMYEKVCRRYMQQKGLLTTYIKVGKFMRMNKGLKYSIK